MSRSNNEDLLERLVDSSSKIFSFFRNVLPEFIYKRCSYVVNPSEKMASYAIDISSSDDSDLREIDEYQDDSPLRDSANSPVIESNPNTRVLPQWANQSSSNPSGYNASSSQRATGYNAPSSQRATGYNASSSSQRARSPKRSSYPERNTSNANPRPRMYSYTARENNGASTSRAPYENDSSQKRMLPQSFNGGRSNNGLGQNIGGNNHMNHETNTNTNNYPSGWSNSVNNGKNHIRDHTSGSNNNGRVLPQSLAHGKSPFVNVNDPTRPSVIGEERLGGTDERIVYQAALQDLNQPKLEASLPDGLLSVSLLRHQKIALAWMLQKETTGNPCSGGILADDQGLGKTISMIAIIQMQRYLQEKAKPKLQNTSTEALNLDDEDEGIVGPSNKMEMVLYDEIKVVQEPNIRSKRPAAGTLVVCPASILQQWAQEIDEKASEQAKLSVVIYHGPNRTKNPIELAKYDVVLTTYTIVTKEVPKQPVVDEDDEERNIYGDQFGLSSEFSMNKKRKKPVVGNKKGKKGKKGIDDMSGFDNDCGTLGKVRWSRVILDEAQTIKNHRTQVARACCSLRAKTRWCLSGTPIQNSIDELFSYFRFLRYDPYAEYKSFCNAIKLSISRNSVTGYKKLQAILRATMLRRTKSTLIDGEPIISLPPKTTELKRLQFTTEELMFYQRLEANSRSQFKKYAEAGTLNQNYANILLMLLRLRQACDHPLLVKGVKSGSVGKPSTGKAKGLPKETIKQLSKLLENSSAICTSCNDAPETGVVTMCRHVFCYQCVSDYLSGEDNTCPAPGCKEQLGAENVFTKSTLTRCLLDDIDSYNDLDSESDEDEVFRNSSTSSKIEAVIDILKSHRKIKSDGEASSSSSSSQNEGPIKTIIFSQWTSMLDLVQASLNRNGIIYRRLDGTMSLPARDKAVKRFKSDPQVTVMLMSLKAGNLGLNMVAACHVILLDLWWNPTTEDQAVDRAHRIGQTKPVTVSRMTIENTVEDRILALQEEKRKMVAAAFGEDHTGGTGTRLTVEDLRYLFNM